MTTDPRPPADESDTDLAARLALVSLPGVGPARARWLLAASPPSEVLGHLRAGRLPPEVAGAPAGVTNRLVQRWIEAVRHLDPPRLLAEARTAGVDLLGPDHDRWPFTDDPDPPVLAFAAGDLDLLARRPAVAIVGTRRCTAIGREVAHDLGAALAEVGIPVVSGLASGIDGAAHRGVLASDGPAVAVAGTGLDVVYPQANAELWHRIAAGGLLLSEAPLGSRPERWRFPARNRLIAALADLVVVVESHEEGGSLLTVGEAADRGVTVMAVPGAVTSLASAGTNQLLVDGCAPVRCAEDVLDALGLVGPARAPQSVSPLSVSPLSVSPLAGWILSEVAAGAAHVDRLVMSSRAPTPQLLAALAELEAAGLVVLDGSTAVRALPPDLQQAATTNSDKHC